MSKITDISKELLTISAAPAGSQEENNTLPIGASGNSNHSHNPKWMMFGVW